MELLSNLIITNVCMVSSLYTPANKAVTRKDRERWALVLKYEGATVYSSNGKTFLSDLNHVVILPMGCSYDWCCTKPGHFFIIEFESQGTHPEPISLPVKNNEKVLRMFKELEIKRNAPHAMRLQESIRDTYSILLQLTSTAPERYMPSQKQTKIAPALNYISQHYNTNITNDLLSELTGLSNVYFRKLFTELMGISPIAYMQRLRIEKAMEMLKSDYSSLSDIAQTLGYPNIYDFSRAFKKHTGIAPSKYAQR